MLYPDIFLDTQIDTLVDLLRVRAAHQPKTIAYTFLVDGETQAIHLTYQALDEQARVIAAHLQSTYGPRNSLQGGYPERALLLYPSGLDYITAFLGCLYAGVIPVPAYPPRANTRSLSRLQSITKDSQAALVLTTHSTLSRLEKVLHHTPELKALPWIATDRLDTSLSHAWHPPDITPDTLALLQYTSGSTGIPKGVMISHRNLQTNLQLLYQRFEHTSHSRGVSWLPPYHDMGLIGGVLQPLYGGCHMALMSPLMFLQSPIRWLKAISRYQATTSGGPNFAYELCVSRIKPEQIEELDLSCWQVAFNGAEPIRSETLARFSEAFKPYGFRSEAFYACYGMAEATLIISGGLQSAQPICKTFNSLELSKNHAIPTTPNAVNSQSLVGCGHTLAGQQIRIVHPEYLTPCVEGEVGEIWVAGPSIAQGYWQQPKESERRFGAYLKGTGEGPFLRTGDLGFLDRAELFITGRLKDLIIINGYNHYPQDIETTVEQCHAFIRPNGCAAFSIDYQDAEQLVVIAELKRDYKRRAQQNSSSVESGITAQQAVRRAIQGAVSKQHHLQIHSTWLLRYGTLPKTSSGKIQRHLCRHQYLTKTLNVIE